MHKLNLKNLVCFSEETKSLKLLLFVLTGKHTVFCP